MIYEYSQDAAGRRVLTGLSEETGEFFRLDASLPYDGAHVCLAGRVSSLTANGGALAPAMAEASACAGS